MLSDDDHFQVEKVGRLALLKRIALMSYYLKFFWTCVGCTALACLWAVRYLFLNPNTDYYTGRDFLFQASFILLLFVFLCWHLILTR